MSFTNTPAQKLMYAKMRHTQQRQEVAGLNIANVGVSGAKAMEVDAFKVKLDKKTSASTGVEMTSTGHLSSPNRPHGSARVKAGKEQGDPTLTGNSINPQAELLKLNEAHTDFLRMSELLKNEKGTSRLIAKFGSGK